MKCKKNSKTLIELLIVLTFIRNHFYHVPLKIDKWPKTVGKLVLNKEAYINNMVVLWWYKLVKHLSVYVLVLGRENHKNDKHTKAIAFYNLDGNAQVSLPIVMVVPFVTLMKCSQTVLTRSA